MISDTAAVNIAYAATFNGEQDIYFLRVGDCNENGIHDSVDLADGTAQDGNDNGILDECETRPVLDIMPGRCPNTLQRRSPFLRLALAGWKTFDPDDVDLDSLWLARADGVGSGVRPLLRVALEPTTTDVAADFDRAPCECSPTRGDGIADLELYVSTAKLLRAVEDDASISGLANVELTLHGALTDGTCFSATDCLLIPARPPPPRARKLPRR